MNTEDNLKKEIISKVNEYQYSTLDYSKEKVIEIAKSETLNEILKWIEDNAHYSSEDSDYYLNRDELTQKLKELETKK